MAEESPPRQKRVTFTADLLAAADTPLPNPVVVKTPSGKMWQPNPASNRMSEESLSFRDVVASDLSQQFDEEECRRLEAELIAAGLMAEGHSEVERREQLLKHVRFYARVAARQKQLAGPQQGTRVVATGSNLTLPGEGGGSGQGGGDAGDRTADGAQKKTGNKRQDRMRQAASFSSASSPPSGSSSPFSSGSSDGSSPPSSDTGGADVANKSSNRSKDRQLRPIEWKPTYPYFNRKADEDVFAWAADMEDALVLARHKLNSSMALLIAQQHLKGTANQNWKEEQGKTLVSAGNWRAWIASLVSDVIGEDGEERLLLSLLQEKATLYKDVESLVLHWRKTLKALHYLWDRDAALSLQKARGPSLR